MIARLPPLLLLPHLGGSGDAADEADRFPTDGPDADWPKGWHRSNPLPAEGETRDADRG